MTRILSTKDSVASAPSAVVPTPPRSALFSSMNSASSLPGAPARRTCVPRWGVTPPGTASIVNVKLGRGALHAADGLIWSR